MRGEVRSLDDLPDPLPGRDVLAGTQKVTVIDRAKDHGLDGVEGEQKLQIGNSLCAGSTVLGFFSKFIVLEDRMSIQ